MVLNFFEFNTNRLSDFLVSKGFGITSDANEIVFTKHHNDLKEIIIKVHSTICAHDSKKIKELGSKAIVVSCSFDTGKEQYSLRKFTKIYRMAPSHMSKQNKEKYLFAKINNQLHNANCCAMKWIHGRQGILLLGIS